MSPQEKVSLLWKRIPRTLFGGRMRTTTVVMCVLWLALGMLNAQLIESREAEAENAPAQTSVQRNEVQDPGPAVNPSPRTSTSTTPSGTAPPSTPPSSPETNRSSAPTTTTTSPGAARETTTERTTDRRPTTTTEPAQESQESTGTTPDGGASTTAPTPQG